MRLTPERIEMWAFGSCRDEDAIPWHEVAELRIRWSTYGLGRYLRVIRNDGEQSKCAVHVMFLGTLAKELERWGFKVERARFGRPARITPPRR